MAKITLERLAHSYQKNPQRDADYALRPLNHVWEDGAAYALLGPSGCGKTTLLNIISGLLQPSEGRVLFDDVDVTTTDTAKRNIAQVFQFPVIYNTMTVKENLAFPLKNRKLDSAYIEKRVAEIAELIDITDELNKKASDLGAAEKQKISLGRGLVREDVNAILFDEPLTVIDPHLKWQLRTQLKALHQKVGHTMIYVTHDQTEALTFADKVVVMSEGQVLQIGTPTELFDRPEHTFVGFFIGSPGMNVLPGKVSGSTAKVAEHEISLPQNYQEHQGTIEIGIRPEFIRISDDTSGLLVDVLRVEDVGHYQIVRTQLITEGNTFAINVIVKEGVEITDGMRYLHFEPEKINVYVDSWLVSGGRDEEDC
ncbi:MAG: ATP-binding cassette domain-containing protein [Alteromonadaceae bacterium]|nr:ATP-binding cassette domain-containing protein [Alteromonadaceae bacterium]